MPLHRQQLYMNNYYSQKHRKGFKSGEPQRLSRVDSYVWQISNFHGVVIKSGGHGPPGTLVPTPMNIAIM